MGEGRHVPASRLGCASIFVMRGDRFLVVLVFVAHSGCKGSSAKLERRADLVSFAASTIEEFDSSTAQQIRLEVTIANTGNTPVDKISVQDGLVFFSGITLEALFSVDPSTNTAPIAPGERRPFVFVATWAPVGRCALAVTCQPNPHFGLLTMSVSVTSDAAKWTIQADVGIDCIGTYPNACGNSVADACQLVVARDGSILHCRPHWADVLNDTLCGRVDSDLIANCAGGYMRRSIRFEGIDYDYYYDAATDSLAGIVSSAGGCIGGPCEGFQRPSSCDELKPFYECPDAGDVVDSAAPDIMPGSCFPLRCRPDAAAVEDATSTEGGQI